MAGKAIFLTGLPGSGKSCYIDSLQTDAVIFDDYKAHAIDDNPSFDHGRRLKELLEVLRAGKSCIISDIDFCRTEAQREAESLLRAAVADVTIEWWCFENDPHRCEQNVLQRAKSYRRDVRAELTNIHQYSSVYAMPAGAKILQVWRPSET